MRRAAEAAKRADQQQAENTFAKAWEAYVEERKADPNGRNRTLDVVDGVRIQEAHSFPTFGSRPVTEITREPKTNEKLRATSLGTGGGGSETPDAPEADRVLTSRFFGDWLGSDGRMIEDGASPFAKLKKFGTREPTRAHHGRSRD